MRLVWFLVAAGCAAGVGVFVVDTQRAYTGMLDSMREHAISIENGNVSAVAHSGVTAADDEVSRHSHDLLSLETPAVD